MFSNIYYLSQIKVRFQILTAASMKIAVFWVAASSCSMIEVYQHTTTQMTPIFHRPVLSNFFKLV
jgi:hypothetical protein